MNSSRLAAPLCALAGIAGATAAAAPVPAPEMAAAQLIEINQRFVDAFVADDADFMAELLDERFVYTGRDGAWLARAEFLARMRAPQPLSGASTEDVRVRLFGPVALVHAAFKVDIEDGTAVQIRYTDVYSWDGAMWRLASAQHTSLKPGVSVEQHTGVVPPHAPWSGQDPTGDDLDVAADPQRELRRGIPCGGRRVVRRAPCTGLRRHLRRRFVPRSGGGTGGLRAAALRDPHQVVSSGKCPHRPPRGPGRDPRRERVRTQGWPQGRESLH